ncbi:geranylgeranyl diphosphate synthase, type I [Lentzea xinjiangensis]|uniref:Geranylgeranyl diphosphate synthase, type I n=1 Tax=Lentzea xinjiangensis TaxID=402600 RepID=A0A1H9JY27_9PSEU|nr:polyprenyl synthetase family protein [Lentzea xinjiangensis]SEQ91712.1 geranylgeranyl diphosphate synthase, type I [Lentzea xinjiangensis]
MSLLTSVDARPSRVDDFRVLLDEALHDFLRARQDLAPELSAPLRDLVLAGGKRIRPTFAWWGWRAAGGAARADAVVRAVVALEMLQCCALVHDDVMDRSATRRGRPSVHESFAARHRHRRWAASARQYGDSAAILVGDLALAWADDALVTAGLPAEALMRAWGPWQAMRTEMITGQHLDLLAVARREESLEHAVRVAALKTAAYTVERPLHLGAALAGADEETVECLRAYGHDIGVAFQLRDDLIGVFGDSSVTGKPVGEDLREGKRTPLMSIALSRAQGDPAAQRLLRRCLESGSVSDRTVEDVRALLVELGAVAAVEEHIQVLAGSGLAALERATIDDEARHELVRLARRAVTRTT